MKENKFLDGISHIEEDVVDRFVKMDNRLQKSFSTRKVRKIWMRVGAIAACFALIFGIVTLMQKQNENYSPIIFEAMVSPEKIVGSNMEIVVGGSVSSGNSSGPPSFEFSVTGIVVKAKVVKNHEDLYYKLNNNPDYTPTGYRLIQMECLDVLHGENVPQYFLYLINESYYVDMSIYDSLLISMEQIGTENFVLKNETKSRVEAFELPMFADYQYQPVLGNIIAFTDGIFDESLWKNENWLYGYQFARLYLDNPESGNLVVKRGASEKKVISNINVNINQIKKLPYYKIPKLITLNFTTQAAKDAVAYVSPFTNGVFCQEYQPYYGNGQLHFTRFINGCQTEETIIVDLVTEEVTYSEVRYTNDDMKQLENIAEQLSMKAKEYSNSLPTPPHTDPDGKELMRLVLYAWYAKVDGKLYGVIKTTWRYKEQDDWYTQYYDDSYILYDMESSTANYIKRDRLKEIVGERNISSVEYGVPIEMVYE